ncbi:MAG: hypothetical protein H8E00_01175 [Deltaproteobacteria bacterium]|nr:hypothetical protein [Deltaproteobacteria bacterium]
MDINEIKKELSRLSKPQLKKLLINLDHVTFPFTINMSFLKYGTHPITIPKEVYDFLMIHDIVVNRNLQILFPDGSTAVGYIYHGKAGYGEYYQIKVKQSSTETGIGVSQFKQGDRIKVEILKSKDREQIKLSKLK